MQLINQVSSVQLIKHVLFIIDTSANLITADIPKISRFVQNVSHEIWQATPLTRIAIAQMNQSKCFLETRFTQDIQELMSFFINDGINQQGTIQLSTALLLLHQLSLTYDNLQAIYINFSPITFDSEQNLDTDVEHNSKLNETNLLNLVELLNQKNVGFNAISVKTDIFILSHICSKLSGYHQSVQQLDDTNIDLINYVNLRSAIGQTVYKQDLKWCSVNFDKNKFILVSPVTRVYQTKICQCCGELKNELWQCLNCKALNCNLTYCCICGLMLITRDTILKTQLLIKQKKKDLFTYTPDSEQNIDLTYQNSSDILIKQEDYIYQRREETKITEQKPKKICNGCEQLIESMQWNCTRCKSNYCNDCAGLLSNLGFCFHCLE